jgi:hypothetical protein
MGFKEIALEIAQLEGKKKQVNIAQINEILKCTLEVIANLPDEELQKLLDEYRDDIGGS